jgi:hypothetical protein
MVAAASAIYGRAGTGCLRHQLAGLQRGFAKREAFCQSVQALVPSQSGEKGVVDQIVSGALDPLIKAIVAIYMRAKDDDKLTRETIQAQLEATSWPAFGGVSSSS